MTLNCHGFSGRYCKLENNVIMTRFIDFGEIIVGESTYKHAKKMERMNTILYDMGINKIIIVFDC